MTKCVQSQCARQFAQTIAGFTTHHTLSCLMSTENGFHRRGYFSERAPCPRANNARRQQIFRPTRRLSQTFQCRLRHRFVAVCFEFGQFLNLRVSHFGVVDHKHVDFLLLFQTVFVDANDGFCRRVDASLPPRKTQG